TVEFDVVVSGAAQEPGGHGVTCTGLAVAHHGALGRQCVEVCQESAGAELVSPGDVSLCVFGLVAHVQNECGIEPFQLLGADTQRDEPGQALQGGGVAGHFVDAHAQQVVANLPGGVTVGYKKHQGPVIDLGVVGPGSEGCRLGRAGDVQRPGHG